MKNKISLKIWIILSSIIILQGLLSTFSSYVYFLNTENPVGYFQLLSQRIISYGFWIVLIPFVYFAVTSIVKDRITFRTILFLVLTGIFIAFFHRLSVIWINDQLLTSNPSQAFITELLEQKYYFISLSYDSFFSYVLLVIFIQIYRISILRKETMIKEESYKKQLANAELKNLKMKFQPHFIFNSLNSISAMAYKNPVIADSMISKLSELLRHSINSADNNITSVEEELQLAGKYIELQKLRFGSRINYSEEIDQNTLNEKIPPFVIQPLLENCVKHAVELTDESIKINTSLKIKDGKLEIEICNTSPKAAKESNNSLGEGIQNLKERLDFIYNGRFKLETKKIPGQKYSVIILIPLNNAK